MMSMLKRPLLEANDLVDITRDHLYNSDIFYISERNAIKRLNRGQAGLAVDIATMEKVLSTVKFETMDLIDFSGIGPSGSRFTTQYPSGIAEPSVGEPTGPRFREHSQAAKLDKKSGFAPLTILNEMVRDVHSNIELVRQEYNDIIELMRRNEEVMVKRAGVRPPVPVVGTDVSSKAVESNVSGDAEKESDFIAGSFDELRQKVKEHSEPPLFTPVPLAKETDRSFITTTDHIHSPGRKKGELLSKVPISPEGNTKAVMEGNVSDEYKGKAGVKDTPEEVGYSKKGTKTATERQRGPLSKTFPKKSDRTAETLSVAQGTADALGLLAGSIRMGHPRAGKEFFRHTDVRKGPVQGFEGDEGTETSTFLGSGPRRGSPPTSAVSLLGVAAATTMVHSTVVSPKGIMSPVRIPDLDQGYPASEIKIPNHEYEGGIERKGLAQIQERETFVQREKKIGSVDEIPLEAVKDKPSITSTVQKKVADNEKRFFPATISGSTTEKFGLQDSSSYKLETLPYIEPIEISGKEEGIPDEQETLPSIQAVPPKSRKIPITLAALPPKDVVKDELKMLSGVTGVINFERTNGFESEITESTSGINRSISRKKGIIKSNEKALDLSQENPSSSITTLSMLSDAAEGSFGLGMGMKNDIVHSIPGEQISLRDSVNDFSKGTIIPNRESVLPNVPMKTEINRILPTNTHGVTVPTNAHPSKFPNPDDRPGEITYVETKDGELHSVTTEPTEKTASKKVLFPEPIEESLPLVPEGDRNLNNSFPLTSRVLDFTPSIPSTYEIAPVLSDNINVIPGAPDPNDHEIFRPSSTSTAFPFEKVNGITKDETTSSSIGESKAETSGRQLEKGALELLNTDGRKKISVPEREFGATSSVSQIPVSTMNRISEIPEIGGRLSSFGPAEIPVIMGNLPSVPSTEKKFVHNMLPTLDGNLLEPLSTIEILNLFSMNHEKPTAVVGKSIEKESFTYRPNATEKALEMLAPRVKNIKERVVDRYLRDIYFNSATNQAIPLMNMVAKKKDYSTNLACVPLGSSDESTIPVKVRREINPEYTLPKVQNFNPDRTQGGSDITLFKSLERLRELKSQDLTKLASKEGDMKARVGTEKTEPGKLENAGNYEIIEDMLEDEAKRHGLVFR